MKKNDCKLMIDFEIILEFWSLSFGLELKKKPTESMI